MVSTAKDQREEPVAKKLEDTTTAAEEAIKRAYVSQSDVPNNGLEDALRVSRALTDNYAGKAATPLQVASALNVTSRTLAPSETSVVPRLHTG